MTMTDISKIKRIAVLGAGESGVGAAILAMSRGIGVLVSDSGKISAKYRDILTSRGIPFEEGGHSEDEILKADMVVKSPGIPPTAPLVRRLAAQGTPIVSEIEFAGYFTDSKMICITGSNGKTTTTMLTFHILREAGLDVGMAGNVGRSLALQVAEEPHEYYVIELSSFQLENMYDFKAHVAVILNITPDHMDRYGHSMELYTAAKFRILRNQTDDDYFIYWLGDPIVSRQVEQLQSHARMLPFSETPCAEAAAWTEDGVLNFKTSNEAWEMPRRDLSLPGLHNLYNSMAAGLSASALHISPEVTCRALADFEAVEHRLEFVREVDGVRYINDSKATNVNSTWYALESMTAPTVLILGGKDKGNDYSEILPLVREKVKAIVCMGVDNSKLLDFFGTTVPDIADCHSLEEAIQACRRLSAPGDTVLLSPCCASFDLFTSYEDRGRRFKDAVAAL